MISVDTKKKELVGQYKNGRKKWRPQGQPEDVKGHDFVDQDWGKPTRTVSMTWVTTALG